MAVIAGVDDREQQWQGQRSGHLVGCTTVALWEEDDKMASVSGANTKRSGFVISSSVIFAMNNMK